jgi:hypothetical protein
MMAFIALGFQVTHLNIVAPKIPPFVDRDLVDPHLRIDCSGLSAYLCDIAL